MTSIPEIRNLQVIHWPKSGTRGAVSPADRAKMNRASLFLDTCLRQMSVSLPLPGQLSGSDWSDVSMIPESRTGADAYRFVLEIATGLRSAVPGETNVFGQLKKAWRYYSRIGHSGDVDRLKPLIQQLFDDASAIRREHLEGIGGSSYGSLVRRLIAPRSDDRILFVGTGDLAQSMLPFFRQFQVGAWNHQSGRKNIDRANHIDQYFSPTQATAAAQWADHVILTTPPDPHNDDEWQARLAAAKISSIVHLGHRRGDRSGWGTSIVAYDLDHVFELRQAQADIRSSQLERARDACWKRTLRHTRDEFSLPLARLAHA